MKKRVIRRFVRINTNMNSNTVEWKRDNRVICKIIKGIKNKLDFLFLDKESNMKMLVIARNVMESPM